MAQWKFQAVMSDAGIETLDDPAINTKFAEQAREFLKASVNPESSKEKLNELDENLVELFNELHTITEEDDEEKVTALRENLEMKRSLKENQTLLDQLNATNAEKDEEIQRLRTENTELKAKIPEPIPVVIPEPTPAPPQPTSEEQKKIKLMGVLAQTAKARGSITTKELQELGVPQKKLDSFISFRHEGYVFDRAVLSPKWNVSKQ